MAVETQLVDGLNGSAETPNGTREPSIRFASGLILPPPEIKCEYAFPLNAFRVADSTSCSCY